MLAVAHLSPLTRTRTRCWAKGSPSVSKLTLLSREPQSQICAPIDTTPRLLGRQERKSAARLVMSAWADVSRSVEMVGCLSRLGDHFVFLSSASGKLRDAGS